MLEQIVNMWRRADVGSAPAEETAMTTLGSLIEDVLEVAMLRTFLCAIAWLARGWSGL